VNYSALNVVEALPGYFHGPAGDEAVFRRLAGASIIRIGSTSDESIEGGGLILDYAIGGEPYRLVFGFSELGMWIEHDSFMSATRDESQRLLSAKSGAGR
jgi:hypothetical protein